MSEPVDYAREYDNSGRVSNAAELIAAYTDASAEFRTSDGLDAQFDLAYGPNERQRLDLFWPDDADGKARQSPIILFIHGGYWQHLNRWDFSHMAKGLLAHGIAVAVPSYTLCPETTIHGIINEMRRACLLLWQTHRRRLVVAGHSAGGHLAACLMATDWTAIHPDLPDDLVTAGMGISGIYDLAPILLTPVNDAVAMNEDDAERASPVLTVPPALHRFEAWVGADESDEYHRQSRDLAAQWSMLGTPTRHVSVDGANHFTVVDPLTDPESDMVAALLDLLADPVPEIALPEPDDVAVRGHMQGLTTALPEEREQNDGDPEQEPAKSAE